MRSRRLEVDTIEAKYVSRLRCACEEFNVSKASGYLPQMQQSTNDSKTRNIRLGFHRCRIDSFLLDL
jgi:hypothetical protein